MHDHIRINPYNGLTIYHKRFYVLYDNDVSVLPNISGFDEPIEANKFSLITKGRIIEKTLPVYDANRDRL